MRNGTPGMMAERGKPWPGKREDPSSDPDRCSPEHQSPQLWSSGSMRGRGEPPKACTAAGLAYAAANERPCVKWQRLSLNLPHSTPTPVASIVWYADARLCQTSWVSRDSLYAATSHTSLNHSLSHGTREAWLFVRWTAAFMLARY